jgi:CheY-like chemotaxis protein
VPFEDSKLPADNLNNNSSNTKNPVNSSFPIGNREIPYQQSDERTSSPILDVFDTFQDKTEISFTRKVRRVSHLKFTDIASSPSTSPSGKSGLRFLVVDDTKTNRKMTIKLLSSLGHFVEEAEDGTGFLELLNLHILSSKEQDSPFEIFFDVVLMDDNMPKMCGPEATLLARKRGYKGLIFGVTGNTRIDEIQNFLDNGADEVFQKPLDIEKLMICIKKFFTSH